jgi:hypothetical protein
MSSSRSTSVHEARQEILAEGAVAGSSSGRVEMQVAGQP